MKLSEPRRSVPPILPAAAALLCAAVLAVLWLRSGSIPEKDGPSAARSAPERTYSAEEFGIETVRSPCDFNRNGTDDYTDFLLGARKDAENKPVYDNSCYRGGYPPDGRGACTDVIWRAFRNAGYCLKNMADRDIAGNKNAYPGVRGAPDPNIDFRRAVNLGVVSDRRNDPFPASF